MQAIRRELHLGITRISPVTLTYMPMAHQETASKTELLTNPLLAGRSRLSDHVPQSSQISVIVVDSQLLFRIGLARLLGEDDRLKVVGESEGGPELPELCNSRAANVVLIDLELGKTDAIQLIRLICSASPGTRVLVLTSLADWRVRPALISGATGFLLKNASPEAIRAAVVSVHLGDQVLCIEAARSVMGNPSEPRLTQREADVLRMIAQGAKNAEIADKLNLGEKTVRNYVSRLYHKLALGSRAQVATYALHADTGEDSFRLTSVSSPTTRKTP